MIDEIKKQAESALMELLERLILFRSLFPIGFRLSAEVISALTLEKFIFQDWQQAALQLVAQ